MKITAENLGKRFNKDWLFKNLNLSFQPNKSYAITGPNGSGKSTLLQIIAGIVPSSTGTISYSYKDHIVSPDNLYQHLSIAAPYQELIEEFTLRELLEFHSKFKKIEPLDINAFTEKLQLQQAFNREIRHFSSGMKQRVKLGLAMFSDSPLLLLDEPTVNLDTQGIDWYKDHIQTCLKNRMVIICSNQRYEYDFCDEVFGLMGLG